MIPKTIVPSEILDRDEFRQWLASLDPNDRPFGKRGGFGLFIEKECPIMTYESNAKNIKCDVGYLSMTVHGEPDEDYCLPEWAMRFTEKIDLLDREKIKAGEPLGWQSLSSKDALEVLDNIE